jgi:hypothetical protein
VTQGEPGERLYGNFPDYTLLPEEVSARALASVAS